MAYKNCIGLRMLSEFKAPTKSRRRWVHTCGGMHALALEARQSVLGRVSHYKLFAIVWGRSALGN